MTNPTPLTCTRCGMSEVATAPDPFLCTDCRLLHRFERNTARLAQLEQALWWTTQTTHQAHHEGAMEHCQKGTCDHAMRVLGRKP